MKYKAVGLDVWFDDRIFARCTRPEDAEKISAVFNRRIKEGKMPVAKKKVRKKKRV